METSYFLSLPCLLLLISCCCTADLKENADTSSGLDRNLNVTNSSNVKTARSNLVAESVEVNAKKEKNDEVSKSKNDTIIRNDVNRVNSSKQSVDSKEAATVLKSDNNSNEESKTKEGDGEKKNLSDDDSADGVQKEAGIEEDQVSLKKEGTRFEECGSSNKCMDDEKNFVACLRVPGNDSPDLSLLIQNKGKFPLSITIFAPDFVQLEKTKVQLQGKEDKKLKVSVRSRGHDNLIILKAGNGNCSLDFMDLIAHNSEEDSNTSIKSFNFQSRKPTIAFVSFAALLMLASGCMYLSYKRRKLNISGSKYQRLDEELPVSGVVKPDSDANDGWDSNWDDGWDDEEAPKTPSLPVTPSLSSKGLASRRLSKDAWKD